MYFKRKEKTLDVSVEEAVRIAYACRGNVGVQEESEALPSLYPTADVRPLNGGMPKEQNESKLFCGEFPFGDISLRLFGFATPLFDENGRLSELSFYAEAYDRISAETLKYLRGVGFVMAYLAGSVGDISLRFEMHSLSLGETVIRSEKPGTAELSRFFERVLSALREDAHLEIDRVVRRLPSFLTVPFPYGEAREGQRDMMSAVRSAVKHGETLFAIAPTGTGKTIAVLFPALRALGAREIDKVFYLTPKNTSAIAALDAVEILSAQGACVRAVHIGAKERLCARRAESGSCQGCVCQCSKDRETAACFTLLAENKAAIGEKEILQAARAHGVCPHGLSLLYSTYADVIVCDYNYLFDPRVSLSRYFDRGGEYFFLIDEAHNLPDRAREMYSAGVESILFDTLISLFSDSARLAEISSRLKDVFCRTVDAMLSGEIRNDQNGKPVGFAYSKTLPANLISALRKSTDVYLKEIRKKKGEESAADKLLRECVYTLKEMCEKADRFDEHFVIYALREGEKRTLRLFCVDPSALISERLDKGRASVFFSATLSPLDYYRAVLCGNRYTSKIEVASPFDSGALCVGAVDSVSVRASAREDTLPEIAKLIISAMRARRGNYMVFCPSFAYMERIAEAFHRLTPKTPIAIQKRNMSRKEREAFLSGFSPDNKGYFVGFCVTGGIYAEGVDLVGERLIGAVIIGMGLPQISAEREMIAAYYEDTTEEGRQYAYFYPALNRVMQAAGRVIRTERDRGIVVLIDDRLRDPLCRKMFPRSWRYFKYLSDRTSLGEYIGRFWEKTDEENEKT